MVKIGNIILILYINLIILQIKTLKFTMVRMKQFYPG